MRTLLAGGAGFIGSHLADALLAREHQVTVVDNLVTGRSQNIEHLSVHPNFEFLNHDVSIPLPDVPSLQRPFDLVVNMASPASPSAFKEMPLEILAVGSSGTRNLLERALTDNARFFFASTSEVYGDPLLHPQSETYFGNVSSIGPRSCYDEAKRFSEALIMAYSRVSDLKVQIVRIFNTYGERMNPNDGRVVNTFIVQALRDEPLTVHGTGRQSRSFCYVADQVAGIIAMIDSELSGPINIGNPSEITMLNLATLIVEIANSKSPIVSVPVPSEREGDPLQRCPDITLARDLLDWEPAMELREGLTRMIHYFRTIERIG